MQVVNIHHGAEYDVYIGRKSIWGNPYSHLASKLSVMRTATREEAIEKYEIYIRSKPDLLAQLHTLEGKTLGCFCKPKPCHGDVLMKLLKELPINPSPPCTPLRKEIYNDSEQDRST